MAGFERAPSRSSGAATNDGTSDAVGGARRTAVYLHIGSPKSGTTFLQGMLWRNRERLAEQDVLLPGGSFGAQERAAWDLRGIAREPTDPAPSWEGRWDDLAGEVLAGRPRVAVMSHETLAAADPGQIERALSSLAGTEVHLIYTARDLAGVLTSEWQEYVKHRCEQDYATWLGEVIDGGPEVGSGRWFWRVHDSVAVLRRWARTLPPERVHIVTVPRPDAPRDLLWRRFAGVLGIEPGAAEPAAVGTGTPETGSAAPLGVAEARSNNSLGVVETELLRRLNLAVDPAVPHWLYTTTITNVLAHKILPRRPGTRRVPFPDDREDWLRERAASLVDGLRAARYDVVGDLAELLPPPDLPPPDHSPVTETDLLEAAADGIFGLLDRVREQRDEIDELRATIADLHAARAEDQGKPLPKAMVRHMSDRHPGVLRMRVAYWHLVERMRRSTPAPDEPGTPADPVTLWPHTPGRPGERP